MAAYQVMPPLSADEYRLVPFGKFTKKISGVGTIYAIESDDGFVKVGFTRGSATARLRGLQTGTPHKLTVVGEFLGTQEIERRIHDGLKKYRVSGEWFRVDLKVLFADLAASQGSL